MPALAAALLLVALAPDALAQATTGPSFPSVPTTPTVPPTSTIPTTPPPVVVKEPPPVISIPTPTPPSRMVRDPSIDLRGINPVGRAATTETPATPRRAALNRLENRLTTPRAGDGAAPVAAKAGAKPQARDLLESAKPIL